MISIFQSSSSPSNPRFQTTRWTVMGGASEPSKRDAAWGHFCSAYWYPVYAFIRRRGEPPEEASDLTQGFFAKLIEQDWLAQVERRESRFSTLLITVLKNFLIKQHRREVAQKRGSGESPVPLDLAQAESWFGAEPATAETPESLFEKRWAHAVMEAALLRLREECLSTAGCADGVRGGALLRLREECLSTGKTKVYELLSPFLSREPSSGDYEAAAEKLGIAPRSVAVAVHRLRADYRAMVREEVAAGLSEGTRVDEEMRALAEALLN